MANNLSELREILDNIMCKCLNRRIVLYGGGYTASYIKWYAKYWHGIDIAYSVEESYVNATPQDRGIFQPSIFNCNYKDIRQCVVWIADCKDREFVKQMLEKYGYIENETYFDLCKEVYGDDLYWPQEDSGNEFQKYKHGKRDIQDLEWLEWKFGCNFITPVASAKFDCKDTDTLKNAVRYSGSCASDIFEILSQCHVRTGKGDAFFDFGCGKGAAIISALEYGFQSAGGVEFEPNLYQVLKDNFDRLDTSDDKVELYYGNASKLELELDNYNYFYFYDPFYRPIMECVVKHIIESISRRKRKVYIIERCYNDNTAVLRSCLEFRLSMQMETNTANRICNLYESII